MIDIWCYMSRNHTFFIISFGFQYRALPNLKNDRASYRSGVPWSYPGVKTRSVDWPESCRQFSGSCYGRNGYGWPILIFGSTVILVVGVCAVWPASCALTCLKSLAERNGESEQKEPSSLLCCGQWCFWHLLAKCCGFYGTISFLVQPAKKSLERAVFTAHEHTIVFEGNVLPARNTVCSWPGKYESAWDSLVEGSQHFGLHDPIPAKQDLQDLLVQVDRQHRPCSAATLHAGGLTFQRQGREGGSQRVFAILSGASQLVSGLASWWGTPLPWRVRRPGQLSEGWSGMTGETRIPLRWKRSYPAWRFIAQGDGAEKGIKWNKCPWDFEIALRATCKLWFHYFCYFDWLPVFHNEDQLPSEFLHSRRCCPRGHAKNRWQHRKHWNTACEPCAISNPKSP